MVLALVGIGTGALEFAAMMIALLLLLLLPFWFLRKNRRLGFVTVTVAAVEVTTDAASPDSMGTDADVNAAPWVYGGTEPDCCEEMTGTFFPKRPRRFI